jgi:GMP synthase-like glutamine amidotransferase
MVLVERTSTSLMDSFVSPVAAPVPTILRRRVPFPPQDPSTSNPHDDDDDDDEDGGTNTSSNSSSKKYDLNPADVGNGTQEEELVLLFLGCEASPPYGPYLHTAGLFLDLLEAAAEKLLRTATTTTTLTTEQPLRQRPSRHRPLPLDFTSVVLRVYPVSLGVFPTPKDLYESDGVILPGSFHSAYDDETWIHQLMGLIQNELVANGIPALGVCFGHQIYAHSFGKRMKRSNNDDNNNQDVQGAEEGHRHHHLDHGGGGSAVKCPAGPQAGRRTSLLTNAGWKFLGRQPPLKKSGNVVEDGIAVPTTSNCMGTDTTTTTTQHLDLFYTHGDMVEQLPPQGVSLGGNDKVKIQAAIYFSGPAPTAADVSYTHASMRGGANYDPPDIDNNPPRVIAVTFQAHPEYASSRERGLEGTLHKIIREMARRGDITQQEGEEAQDDAALQYEHVREQSIAAVISACQLLGWFPRFVEPTEAE